MLNINEYINSTEEIKFKGFSVKVFDLDTELFIECCESAEGLTPQELFTKQAELARKILNRNDENREFTQEFMMHLPIKAIDAVLKTMIKRARKAQSDPN